MSISWTTGGLLGALLTLALTAVSYLTNQLFRLPFVPFDIFDWLARVLPGDVVTLGIDTIIGIVLLLPFGAISETAKLIEQSMAVALLAVAGTVAGGVTAILINRTRRTGPQTGIVIGLAAFVIVAAIELASGVANAAIAILWLALLFLTWGWLLGASLQRIAEAQREDAVDGERRNLLLQLAGGSLGVTLTAWGIGRFFGHSPTNTGAGETIATADATASVTASATTGATAGGQAAATATPMPDRIPPAPGTRPEVTPTEDFYRIDINTRPVVIRKDEWELEVAGLFETPRSLTLDDLMNDFEPVTQAITLSCISNSIGGSLISTAYWTGARLRDVLADLGFQARAKELFIEAEDGFFESVAMQDLMNPRTLLVYGMNGETLPTEHGFPLRIYIPNRYGMKQPKWITRIEAIDEEGPGYWVERGWSAEAIPHIVSVIDTVAEEAEENGRIPVGGIAWAGNRGIRNVEVQVDDGDWQDAELRTPPLSQLTWVQWRYEWPAQSGRHTFRVRATDGEGTLQTEEETDKRPDGATGYHSLTKTF